MKEIWLDQNTVKETLERIRDVKVCVVGDVCLDVYWLADMKRSRLSRETPHFPLPVIQETYGLGGAGNVADNIAAIGAAVIPVSAAGDDWRYGLLKDCFARKGIPTEFVFQLPSRVTPAYCKPIRAGISDVRYEDPRIDFENFTPLKGSEEKQLLDALRSVAEDCDVIAVCDQHLHGVVTPALRELLIELGRCGKKVIVDSRDRVAMYKHVIVKPNEVEAVNAVGLDAPGGSGDVASYAPVARTLNEQTGSPVIVTLGDRGALWCECDQIFLAPAKKAEPPIDIVGAGDTFLAAFACAYAAGLPGGEALAFANLASGVTVKKIGETGTATPKEIIQKQLEQTI